MTERPIIFTCPYGEVGSRLWVRETFARIWANADGPSDDDTIEYRARRRGAAASSGPRRVHAKTASCSRGVYAP